LSADHLLIGCGSRKFCHQMTSEKVVLFFMCFTCMTKFSSYFKYTLFCFDVTEHQIKNNYTPTCALQTSKPSGLIAYVDL